MKRIHRRLLKSLTALALTVACLSSSVSYAAVVPGSNADGTISNIPADAGVCEPGVLLYLDTVVNTADDNVKEVIVEKEEAYKDDPDSNIWYDEIGWQIQYDHLISCPPGILDPLSSSMTEKGVLIVRDTGTDGKYWGSDIKTGITHQFMMQSGQPGGGAIQNIYVVPRTTCSKSTLSFSLVSAQIKADGLVDDFYKDNPEQVTMDYINSYVSSHTSEMDAAVSAFLYHFRDTGSLAAHMKTLLKDNPELSEEVAKENLLQYLDLLVLINYMSGGTNDSVVEVFLNTKNRNDSEEFAVIFMGAMMSWGTSDNFTWMSFPMNMYAAVKSPDISTYGSLTISTFQTNDALRQTADSTNAYSSANPAFAEEYWQALMGATNTVSSKFNTNKGALRGANIARMWFTTAQCNKYGSGVGAGLGTVFTLMPTDIFGNQKGALGYTYFSTAGIAMPDVPDAAGQITLKVTSSNNTTVEKAMEGTCAKAQVP